MSLQSPLNKVLGLGSAKEGTGTLVGAKIDSHRPGAADDMVCHRAAEVCRTETMKWLRHGSASR